ncbi:sentrin-specific protease-like [Anoplophora glabripennis]|uniref:sentrin-specific protease-like n=1 Tax=Anoplophora glabripennis TaxID=217634 RepID=UPI0008741C09|nr:sentrin-specific protease-like [Anoplophora glabripennis]
MDNLRGILEYIRNFFGHPSVELQRKRRAPDPLDHFLSPKCRRVHISMADRIDNDWLTSRNSIRRRTLLKPSPRLSPKQNRHTDTVVLDDDDDDVIEIKKPDIDIFQGRSKHNKYTSTPENYSQKCTNGIDDDDITFVKEIKSPKEKMNEASKRGLNYIKPFTGRYLNIGSIQNEKSKERTLFNNINKRSSPSRPFVGSSSLDYSYRLDDKLQYKKLLESAGVSGTTNDSSIYQTPVGRLFNYDTSNRSGKIMNMLKKPSTGLSNSLNGTKDRMSTKDRIIKVLDDFESIEVKDSDTDSDVIIVNPPSPKPDIKVEPVNSFKKVVDTSQQTKSGWLDELVERHRLFVEQRQKEIDQLRECSEKHGKINNDLRWEILTDKVNRSLSIRDAVLPVEEKEEEVELPLLTEAQLKLVEHAYRGDPNEILARKFNLNVSRRDLQTLAGLNWLNDEVINFYMNLIIERGKDSKWPKSYAFNTFFYTKLLKDGPQSLRRWTKRVDIFEHDIICVPIHLGMHWCMAIINLKDRSIRYYDSMGSSNNKCLEALRRYLEAEHLDKKKTGLDTSDFILENIKDIPQQMNGSDCGMFACTFAEFLTRSAKITFSQEHMPYLRKKMVVEIISGELLIK